MGHVCAGLFLHRMVPAWGTGILCRHGICVPLCQRDPIRAVSGIETERDASGKPLLE